MNNFSADSVLDRLQQAMNVNSDSALAKALSVNRATLGNWRARDSVPYSICVEYSIVNGLSLNWLLAGDGDMSCDEKSRKSTGTLNIDHEKLRELFESLSAEQQQATLQFMLDKQRLNALEIAVFSMQQQIIPSAKTE
jgi:hypothetical protein